VTVQSSYSPVASSFSFFSASTSAGKIFFV
jgi:hypothetical protein